MKQLTRENLKKILGGNVPGDGDPSGSYGESCGGTGPAYCWAKCTGSVTVYKKCNGATCSSQDNVGAFCTQSNGDAIECNC